MLSLSIILDGSRSEDFPEILSACLTFLDQCTPKKRDKVRFVLLNPRSPYMPIVERLQQSGYVDHFVMKQTEATSDSRELLREGNVWVHSGSITDEWAMKHICGKGGVLIHYNNHYNSLKAKGPWYFEVGERHPEDRKLRLVLLFKALFDDPTAMQCLRKRSFEEYNSYCNQMTRKHLEKVIFAIGRERNRLSA